MNMPAQHSVVVKKNPNKILGLSRIGIKNKRGKNIMLVCKLMTDPYCEQSVRFRSSYLKKGTAKPDKVQRKATSMISFNI